MSLIPSSGRAVALAVLSVGLLAGCSSTQQRSGRAYPASARVESRGGQSRYVVCHKDRQTKTLPESAVRGHLRHGDRLGACRRDRGDRQEARGRNDRRDRNDRRGRDDRDRNNRGQRGNG